MAEIFGLTTGFWTRSVQKILPFVTMLVILLAVFLVYSYSISHERLFLGTGDSASRFLIAMEYARDLSQAWNLKSWVSSWPPVPFIIQGFVLRLVFFPGMSDASTGIMAVQLTSVFLTLLGFFFISRSVALQTDESTGLLACLMCFCASILLYLAHTPMSEVYAFFFISLAIWNLFRFITQNKGLGWSVLSFALAYFCRTESLLFAFVAGAFLLIHHRWRSAMFLVGTTTALAVSQILGASLLVEGIKLYERGVWGGKGLSKLRFAWSLTQSFWSYNKELILLSCVCALPLVYYAVKRRNFPKAYRVANNSNSINKISPITTRKANLVIWLSNTYRQIDSWVVRVPVTVWIVFFLVAMGAVILMALQGSIEPQPRYLFMANVFMTTVTALLAAQAVRILYASNKRFAKRLALGIIVVLVLFSLWSGFSHATGRKVEHKMSPSMKDVIHFIREHKVQGDRVAFDFLNWQEYSLAAYLLDPSLTTPTQFVVTSTDPEVKSLLPKQFQEYSPQRAVEAKTALIHAFIHSKHPRFLVLASNKFYDSMRTRVRLNSTVGFSINPIRQYLSPVIDKKSEFTFQSPYVLPKAKILFTKIYENDSFIILEQTQILENRR